MNLQEDEQDKEESSTEDTEDNQSLDEQNDQPEGDQTTTSSRRLENGLHKRRGPKRPKLALEGRRRLVKAAENKEKRQLGRSGVTR